MNRWLIWKTIEDGNQVCKYDEPDKCSKVIEGAKIDLSNFLLNCRRLSSN